jgi:hypothetical protein
MKNNDLTTFQKERAKTGPAKGMPLPEMSLLQDGSDHIIGGKKYTWNKAAKQFVEKQ